jgi:hypothetical protein
VYGLNAWTSKQAIPVFVSPAVRKIVCGTPSDAKRSLPPEISLSIEVPVFPLHAPESAVPLIARFSCERLLFFALQITHDEKNKLPLYRLHGHVYFAGANQRLPKNRR